MVTGDVGIGTTSPTVKLDVNGIARIAGWAEQSIGTNGYARIGNIMFQWGDASSSIDGADNFTFPTSFTTTCYNVQITRTTTNSINILPVTFCTTTSFTIDRGSDISGSQSFNFFAIGY